MPTPNTTQTQNAWQQRLQGIPWKTLATQYGCTTKQLQDACIKQADAELDTPKQQTIQELDRLNQLQTALWPTAQKGNTQAIAQIQAIITQRQELQEKLQAINALQNWD